MKVIISCVLFLFTNFAFSQSVVKSDKDYFSVKGSDYKYIFPSQYERLIPELDRMNTYLKGIYQKDFNWKLDEETSFVLGSSWNQIANAFATNIPNLNTTFYNGGFEVIDTFATSSWLKTLLLHETAHLYQLNTKGRVSTFVKDIFGNNIVSFFPFPISVSPISFFPVPVVTNPNFFLPNWMIEGNAVLNESRFGIGGRLYSGEIRAFVYAMAKANLFNASRITNIYAEFPYGRNSYLAGGYAWAYMSEKYGSKQANKFYQEHADHYFNPFLINGDFKKLYGKEYKDLINEMGEHYKKIAMKQKQVNSKALVSSKEEIQFNKIKDEVIFLTTKDNASFRKINSINIGNKNFSSKDSELKSGKIFNIQNELTVASSGLVDRNKIRFSLWTEEELALPKYLDHFVMDMKGSNVLSFKSNKTFGEGELYLNDKFYAEVNSTAMFGKGRSIYYFKQDGERRTLYRNKKALIDFKGFYSKLVDVTDEGEVFFISSTELGSSLFKFDKGQIYRVSSFDNIVNAKLLKYNKVIVSSVNESGYEASVINLESVRKEVPFDYEYGFEKEKQYGSFQKSNLKKVKIKHAIKSTSSKKDYNSLANIRMGSWSAMYMDSDANGAKTTVTANFSDPLAYNHFSFYYDEVEENAEQDFSFTYLNNKNLLSWGFQGLYEKRTSNKFVNRLYKDKEIQELFFILEYNWLKYRNWKLTSRAAIGQEFGDDEDKELYANFRYRKVKTFSNNLLPFRYSNFLLEYEQEDEDNRYALSYDLSHGFENQKYLMFSSTFSYSDGNKINIGEQLQGGELISFSNKTAYSSKEGIFSARVGASYKMVANVNWLSWYFPLGLRRVAIGPEATYMSVHTNSSSLDFNQIGLSADIEVLANHTYPVLANISLYSQESGSLIDSLSFKLSQEF